MKAYFLDQRGVWTGKSEDAKSSYPSSAGAYVTDQTPPTPGPNEVVIQAGGGRWRIGPPPPWPEEVGPSRLHRGSFATDLLTAAENDAWIDLVDEAEQTAPASRTQTQKDQLRAWRHFSLHEYIDRENDFTQAACMALYLWGVLGPVYDNQSGEPPTEAELAAIARADRIAKFLPPEP